VIVAQPSHEVTLLAEILSSDTTMAVSLAATGVLLRPSYIYVCPAAHHVVVGPAATLTVWRGPRVRFFRPSGDWLFESAAAKFGAQTLAIVLSGSQDDGARGAVAVRNVGGRVVVQEPATCDHPQMPLAAIGTGAVNDVLVPDQIAHCVNTLLANLER
jgi:two-component system, chemotaxis family, protein-glutamate methylesterase/glutaminase